MSRWLIIGLSAGAVAWLGCVAMLWSLCRIAAKADRKQQACVDHFSSSDRRIGRGVRPHTPALLSDREKRLDIAQGDWQEQE